MSEKQAYPEAPPPYVDPQHPPYSSNEGGPNYSQPPPATSFAPVPTVSATATTTVIITSHVPLSPNPVSMQCPHCHSQIVTSINYITGTLTWIICVVLLLFGLWCGCCLIPFCVPECQDVEHRCPNCSRVIGVYRRV